ncbi:PepSY domain-containing protein [Luteimonas huabeiensis]|uniref:PepSY domain-containing protein n=1 Tax=Luteimonas huabeiensis TaxID=1244513 RepID=UPI000467C964|nr:PepSY domain-containing protein [Luteimonas huabeiensis]
MTQRNARRLRLLAAALGLALAGTVVAQDAMREAQVRSALEAQGYTDIHDVKFDDGLWEADATSADGRKVDVRIDPASGEIFPDNAVSQVSEAEVRARLSAAGYGRIGEVEFDDGLWKAEAWKADGRKMKVLLAPQDGRVLHERAD